MALNRSVERACVAAGKVAARRSVVGHEQSVAGKDSVADDIGQTSRCVAGNVKNRRIEIADLEAVAVQEKLVELAAVFLKLRAGVEDLTEDLLNANDLAADRKLAAEFSLQERRRRQVVGMRMRLKKPLNFQAFGLHIIDKCASR